ncbi:hypothetical protein B0H15DRAFT_791823, partial [Mycena belliarum]
QVVETGMAMYERSAGPQLVFVDPRRSDDARAMVRSARRLVKLFCARGMQRSEIVVSIPATEAGVAAAQELQHAYAIHTNLILVAGLMHAGVCAEARATAISIAVGPLLRSHEQGSAVSLDLATHPGIEAIQATLAYFKLHGLRTRIVGRDFRAVAELHALRGFDAVCLSQPQLDAWLWAPDTPDTPRPQAVMRARQAQYPTAFLAKGAGFLSRMSAAARGALAGAVWPALARMRAQMDTVEAVVEGEVAWQLAARTLSLGALYALRDAPRAEGRRGGHDEGHVGRERTGTPLGEARARLNEDGEEYF